MHKSEYFNKIDGFFTNYTNLRNAFLYNLKNSTINISVCGK
jgi:hypothetical protein